MSWRRRFYGAARICCLAGVIFMSGCGTFLVYPFFPRTGAHGVVLDQYDKPVTNCEIQALWVPASMGCIMMPPQYVDCFQTDQLGKWEYYRRDADHLSFQANPPMGYSRLPHLPRQRWPEETDSIDSGQCPTNDFILRLRKLESVQSHEEKK